jgi:hypothetical protein
VSQSRPTSRLTVAFRVRGITRPGSSAQITVEPDGGAVQNSTTRALGDGLRVGARSPPADPPPPHLPGQQDPPHLAAPHGDAGIPGRLGQESRVYCAGARSPATGSFPAPSPASRPGGSEWAMAMMADRCALVIRCLRPAPAGARARRRRLR